LKPEERAPSDHLAPARAGVGRRDKRHLARRLRAFGWVFGRLSREGRALFFMACAAMLFGSDLGRSESHVLVLATLSLITSTLLFARAYPLPNVVLELSLPRRVSVGDELEMRILLSNRGPRARHRIRTEVPQLPRDGRYTELPADIPTLPAGGRQISLIKARFMLRGPHQLQPFRPAALLPLGLSHGAPLETGRVNFVVVPRLARVLSIQSSRARRQQLAGVARTSRTGEAPDLLGVRPYRPGDPLRDLHARSWARHGCPMVREYQEEQCTRVGIVVDSDKGARGAAHVEGALSLAAGIVASLCQGETRVEVLVCGHQLQRLSVGAAGLEQALDALGTLRAGSGFDTQALLGLLGSQLDCLSSVLFVALAWDAARAAFVAAVEARGVSCEVYVVGDHAERTARTLTLPLSAITSGQGLAL
jgi:uncharacterized protein (DUF58 family)